MSNPSSKWADLRDFCSAIREVVIVAAMLSLLVVPSAVRHVLERAGIRSVAGVEFDVENLAQSRDELNSALAQIDSLRNQLSNAQQQVQGLVDSAPLIAAEPSGGGLGPSMRSSKSPSASPSLASVSRLISSMKDQAEETERSLRRSKVHTDKFVEQAGSKLTLTPPDELFRNRVLSPETATIPEDETQRLR